MPDNLAVPSEFKYTVFTKVIQDIIVEVNDYAKKNIMPEISIPGQILRANINNPTRRIIKKGIKPLNSVAHFNPHTRATAITVPMINYLLSDRFDMSDFVFQASMQGVNNQEDIAAYINKVMAEKKVNMENTIEWMIWETILEGKFSYEGIEYDYSPSATQYITLAGGGNDWDYKWNVTADADIKATIDHVYALVKALGGGKIVEALACKKTWDTAMRSTKLKAVYNEEAKGNFLAGNYSKPISGVTPVVMDNDYQLETGSTVYDYIPEGTVIFKTSGPLGNIVTGDSYIPGQGDQIVKQAGRFAYPVIEKNPVGVLNVTGLTFLPELVNKYSYAVVEVY